MFKRRVRNAVRDVAPDVPDVASREFILHDVSPRGHTGIRASDFQCSAHGVSVWFFQIVAEGIAGVKSATVKHQKDERGQVGKQARKAQDSFFDDNLDVIDNR